jgi:hypothetical protein
VDDAPTDILAAQLVDILSALGQIQGKIDDLSERVENQDRKISTLQAGGKLSSGSPSSSPTHKKPKKDNTAIYQAILQVMFAIRDENDEGEKVYKLPKLTANCLELLAQSDTHSFSTTWRFMHNRSKHQVSESSEALASRASTHFLASVQLVKKFLSGVMYSLPLGRLNNINVWKNDWSLAHFSTPVDNSDYKSFHQQYQDEANSDLQYSVDSVHATKKNFNLFFQNHFDESIETILQCVANFILFASTLVHIPSPWTISSQNPQLINILLRLSEELVKEDTKTALAECSKTYPHVYFTVFSYFQDILSAVGHQLQIGDAIGIAKSIDDPNTTFLSADLYKEVENQAFYSREKLSNLLNDLTLPAKPPASYDKIHPPLAAPTTKSNPVDTTSFPNTNQSRNKKYDNQNTGNTTNANTIAQAVVRALASGKGGSTLPDGVKNKNPPDGKGDWLEISSGTKPNEFFEGKPRELAFCLHHALKGFKCNMPRPCKYKHVAYCDFTNEQKALFDAHLNEKNKDAIRFSLAK